MLRKLMKYEFMATGRVFLPLFAALLILSVINRLLSYLPVDTPQVIGIIVSVILIVGIMVITLVLTLQRFRRNLLSNEGYLMMTLPVSADSLILSKMFVATIWGLASSIVVMISIMIMAMTSFTFDAIARVFNSLGRVFTEFPAESIIVTIEAFIMVALSSFVGILLLYTCMSLSMLVNKRRGLFTFGAFIVITTVLQVIFTIVVAVFIGLGLSGVFNKMLNDISTFGQVQLLVLFVFLVEAAVYAAFYLITRYMLIKRLNLQ